MFYYQTQLKSHENYPYQNWNTDVQDYILLNLFWIKFVNQFDLEKWEYGLSYYVNFDDVNDRDFSTDVIFIKNVSNLKMLAISPITNYEKNFHPLDIMQVSSRMMIMKIMMLNTICFLLE